MKTLKLEKIKCIGIKYKIYIIYNCIVLKIHFTTWQLCFFIIFIKIKIDFDY